MKQILIKIDEDTYNNFLNNRYSRTDAIAIHTALVNGIPLPKEEKTEISNAINLLAEYCKGRSCKNCSLCIFDKELQTEDCLFSYGYPNQWEIIMKKRIRND